MQYASFTGLIRTLLIILLIYYLFQIIAKYVIPLFMKRFLNNMEQKFREQHQPKEPDKKVGETTILKKPNTNKSNNNVGEYIDYEEVNDD